MTVKKKLRPIGQITAELEPLLEEMTDGHDMQWHEVLALIFGWLQVHAPQAREEYTDGGYPEFQYGPKYK